MNRGDWQATVHGLEKKLEVTQQLNNNSNIHLVYSVKIKLATYTAWGVGLEALGNESFLLFIRSHTLAYFLFDHIFLPQILIFFFLTSGWPIRFFYAQTLGDPRFMGVSIFFFFF